MAINFNDTNVFSAYEYVTSDIAKFSSDIPETMNTLIGNALDFNIQFSGQEFNKYILHEIADQFEPTAVYFGEQQGLSAEQGHILHHSNFRTEVGNKIISFTNEAQDDRGHYYAGHVEYGHYARDGKTFVPARPFMRPALYAVSKASRGEIADVLQDLVMGIFRNSGLGYQGIKNLSFGINLGEKYHLNAPSSQWVANRLKESTLIDTTSKYYKKGMSLDELKSNGLLISGRDLNTHPFYERRTQKPWSIKRGSTSKIQTRMRQSVGFTDKGRNLKRVSYNRQDLEQREKASVTHAEGKRIVEGARAHTSSFHSYKPKTQSIWKPVTVKERNKDPFTGFITNTERTVFVRQGRKEGGVSPKYNERTDLKPARIGGTKTGVVRNSGAKPHSVRFKSAGIKKFEEEQDNRITIKYLSNLISSNIPADKAHQLAALRDVTPEELQNNFVFIEKLGLYREK